ncbi:MAG: hypothetical protein QOE11_121 [Solirubrobacteraceae bacterium]|nr:hypothetical protein [Solirubrobacteraceae bacterium]
MRTHRASRARTRRIDTARRGLLLTAVAAGMAVMPSPAFALVAPGRVTVPFMTGQREGVDPFAVAGVAVMPDGRIVTSGIAAGARRLLLTRVLRSGAPDPAFGGDGIVSLDVPRDPATYGPFPGPPQVAADGSVYVASAGSARARSEGQQAVVTHVLADGTLDPAFGTDGSATPGVQAGALALTGDGRVLLAGHIGRYDITNLADASATTTAVVARLTAHGDLDPTFGAGGIAPLPGNDAGVPVALPDGGVAVTTSQADTSRLVELGPDGSVAPGFDRGAPLVLPGFAEGLLAHPDGSVDVLSTNRRRTAGALVRIKRDGAIDASFGGGSVAVSDGALIAGPGGSDLVSAAASFEPLPGQPFALTIRRVLADGSSDPSYGGVSGRVFTAPFGGGYGTIGAIHAQPTVATLDQTGFRGGAVGVRPGGGLVVAGAAAVIQYTGEGAGIEHEDVALAAFGPELAADPSFGGPAVAPSVTFSLPRQRAATAASLRRRYVLVRLAVSTPGLCQISVRARGAVVAKADVPVFAVLGQNAHVWLTRSGRRLLPRARRAAATARATCEDLIGSRTTAGATGMLR